MKSILRNVVFYSVALFLTSQAVSGLKISGGTFTYFVGGIALSMLFLIVKPILSIVTLPLNIITLGWFSFVINAIILYLLTIFVTNISITPFTFAGVSLAGFIIPKVFVNSFFAFLAVSVSISLIMVFLKWLTKK